MFLFISKNIKHKDKTPCPAEGLNSRATCCDHTNEQG